MSTPAPGMLGRTPQPGSSATHSSPGQISALGWKGIGALYTLPPTPDFSHLLEGGKAPKGGAELRHCTTTVEEARPGRQTTMDR